MTAAVFVVALVGGYLVGSLSPAALVAHSRHVDLRHSGSGNPGATNVARVLGIWWGVLVGVLDIAKGAVPAGLFGLYAERAGLIAGLAAVAGHVSSPFLRGRGGKGVATAFGAVLGVAPVWALVVAVVFVLVAVTSRWIALASMSAAVALLAVALVVQADRPRVAWAAALAGVVLFRHRRNVVARWRARRGDAPI